MTDDRANSRLIFPQLGRFYRSMAPFSYSFMRFCTGAVLVPHGVQKFFFGGAAATAKAALGGLGPDLSFTLAYVTGGVELLGGGLLAVGLLTRLAALSIVVEMSVIVFVVLWPNGYFWTNRGVEYALLWGLLAIAFFFRGGGRYSVDCMLPREL